MKLTVTQFLDMINLDNIIDSTIEEINKQLPRDKKVDKKVTSRFLGPKVNLTRWL